MWNCIVTTFVILEITGIESSNIPSYLTACSKTKDFKACAVKNGNEALPNLLKGDKEFKIPNLLPLKFPRVDVDAGPNLKISLTDIELNGLDTITLKDMNVDFDKNSAYIDLDAKQVELIGTYDVDGKILILPIQGSGPVNIKAENCNFKYIFNFKLEKKGNFEFIHLQPDDQLEFKIQKAHFQLDNLFNGNKAMGDNVNKFLNENDQDVIKELGGAITGTIRVVARQVGGAVLENIPFKDLFLD